LRGKRVNTENAEVGERKIRRKLVVVSWWFEFLGV
jgi:hypothetical protein